MKFLTLACALALGALRAASAPGSWTGDLSPIDRAAHLLERAGFGGTPEEIRALAAMAPGGGGEKKGTGEFSARRRARRCKQLRSRKIRLSPFLDRRPT